MPSGSKKRKAAKKKKELESHSNPSSPGKEDAKSQDDKGSDSGEIDSPASQNHSNYSNPFGDEKNEIQDNRSPNTEGPSNVETYHEVGPTVTSERKNGTVRYESLKGSLDDDHSSRSSNDESTDTTKKPEVLDGKTVASSEFILNLVTPEVDDSASGVTISIVESASAENTAMLSKDTRDLSSKPKEDKDLYSAARPESSGNFEPESEDEPLIESRPLVPKTTSWLSCCGLGDVFTGSNR